MAEWKARTSKNVVLRYNTRLVNLPLDVSRDVIPTDCHEITEMNDFYWVEKEVLPTKETEIRPLCLIFPLPFWVVWTLPVIYKSDRRSYKIIESGLVTFNITAINGLPPLLNLTIASSVKRMVSLFLLHFGMALLMKIVSYRGHC